MLDLLILKWNIRWQVGWAGNDPRWWYTWGMEFDLRIEIGHESTCLAVRPGIIYEVGRLLRALMTDDPAPVALVVTDGHVGPLYGTAVLTSLSRAGFPAFEHRIEPGERSKCLAVLDEVYRSLLDASAGRDAVVVALGGGVVSDLAGFAAATWMRGVRFVICPTTLEADVDASIGGKTAVNLPGGKNLVGAFHQPILVAIDPECLRTLDPRDVRAGMAESIKHALISAEAFLAWHEQRAEQILSLDDAVMSELILRNLRIKAEVVHADAQERIGLRMRLNFGHTLGHAIEACSGFALRHGECVALGMLAACRLSRMMGLLEASVEARVKRLLERIELPTRLTPPIDPDVVLATIRGDKKARGGQVQFVLLEGVGRPAVRADVPERVVREAYESLYR